MAALRRIADPRRYDAPFEAVPVVEFAGGFTAVWAQLRVAVPWTADTPPITRPESPH